MRITRKCLASAPALCLLPVSLFAQPAVVRLTDPVTGRKITWFHSPHHEVHHYYDIPAWDPAGERILFFRFDSSVEKLSARGRFPGSLWIMKSDGSDARKVSGTLQGNYHTGVNQLWGPDGKSVFYSQGARTTELSLVTSATSEIPTPVQASRVSPDFRTLSCVASKEAGVYHIARGTYRPVFTLEEARAASPSEAKLKDNPSSLQNTRFSPDGTRLIIVHRTNELFPSVVEVFIHDFRTGATRFLAGDLHHPTWRPDSGAVMFVRRRASDNLQSLVEADVSTGRERALTREHIPAVHVSYHPRKAHLALTDCYGGPLGYGLAVANLETGEVKQLVTIPLGVKPGTPADDRFPFRNWGLWIPQRPYLNEPRPAWNADGTAVLYTSEESGRINLYVVDTSDL